MIATPCSGAHPAVQQQVSTRVAQPVEVTEAVLIVAEPNRDVLR